MNSVEFSTTCRICLQDDATYPIFDESTTEASMLSQLNKCFTEKIEDLEGYPRSICSSCKIAIDFFCQFIDKYRQSCEILREALLKVKTEVDESFSVNDDDFLGDNEEYVVIDVENRTEKENMCNTSEIIEKLKPLPGLKITKVDSKKCLKGKESKTTIRKTKNSKLVLSIMEDESECNGDEWRKITKTSEIKKNPPKKSVKQKVPKNMIKLEIIEKPNPIKSSVLCDYCGAVFDQKHKLRRHIERRHNKIPVTCTICSKTYPSDLCLKLHQKRCHTEKTLPCEYCPKMFTTKDLLQDHIKKAHKKHLFPRIFPCKYCDKTFKGYYCAKAHERAVHTGLRPAVCKVCDKAFYHVPYLRQHMRLHTGELPYKCPFCDRACAIHSNLKSHLRTHKKSELNDTIMSKMRPGYFKFLKNC